MDSTPQQILSQVRGKDPLDGLCKTRQIAPEACDWVKAAVDPFHDFELSHLNGYPDVNTEPSVLVKVRQSVEISAPADTTGNWDCHLFLSPVDAAIPSDPTVASSVGTYGGRALPRGDAAGQAGTNVISVGNNQARMDGLVYSSTPSATLNDANFTFTPGHMPLVPGAGYEAGQINLDDYLDADATDLTCYRLVYSGFEVVNTTAQIYKQGAVTVYEYGNTGHMGLSNDSRAVDTGAATPQHQFGCPTTYFRNPPNKISEAKIMPGAHTWAAQDGCYCTSKFQGQNDYSAMTARAFAIAQNNPDALSDSGYRAAAATPTVFDRGSFFSGTDAAQSPATHFSQMNSTGAYFTGLSSQSTLFVTWRVGLERLPAANKPTFLALATPCAPYDPNALALYNLIVTSLPPGCPQGFNDAGEWFRMVSAAARKVIPAAYPLVNAASTMLTMMGRPALAAGVSAIGNGMKALAGSKSAPNTPRAKATNKQPQKTKAVQNFGVPGKGGQKMQQFKQMS